MMCKENVVKKISFPSKSKQMSWANPNTNKTEENVTSTIEGMFLAECHQCQQNMNKYAVRTQNITYLGK